MPGPRAALTALPTRPPAFRSIPNALTPGVYIVGHDKMVAADRPITSLWRRQTGPSEEFVLGILSVFLIAVLSEIVFAVLLRTRAARLPAASVRAAARLDALAHFRRVAAHLRAAPRPAGARAPPAASLAASLAVLAAAAALFAADVVAVLLTQPAVARSHRLQYNLRAVQPVATTPGRARFIRRVAGDRGCVSPVIMRARQRRNFQISACIAFDHSPAPAEPPPPAPAAPDTIVVSSWYHRGGSDHRIAVAHAWHSVSIRAQIFVDADNGHARRLLFNTTGGPDHAFYLQELVVYAAMEWACTPSPTRPPPQTTCQHLLRQYTVLNSTTAHRRIVLWRGKTDDVVANVSGLVTTFRVPIPAPFRALNSGLRALVTSAAIEEVSGPGAYRTVADDRDEDGIEALISEEGRIAGVYMMLLIFAALLVVMLVLRCKFRPASLADVAIARTADTEHVYLDEFEQQEREIVRRRQLDEAFREAHKDIDAPSLTSDTASWDPDPSLSSSPLG